MRWKHADCKIIKRQARQLCCAREVEALSSVSEASSGLPPVELLRLRGRGCGGVDADGRRPDAGQRAARSRKFAQFRPASTGSGVPVAGCCMSAGPACCAAGWRRTGRLAVTLSMRPHGWSATCWQYRCRRGTGRRVARKRRPYHRDAYLCPPWTVRFWSRGAGSSTASGIGLQRGRGISLVLGGRL
jgi:hypothetical protein